MKKNWTEPIEYTDETAKDNTNKEKYKKYRSKDYVPSKHEYIE